MEAWMLGRQERELALVTELSHLLSFPSPTTPTCGSTSPGLCVDGERLLQLRPGVTTVAGGGRRRGRKRVRDKAKLLQAYDEDGVPFPANAEPLGCSKTSSCTKMKQQKTPTVILITTVPDFDGYQWRKYGQKPIEGANYPRSYYRCTNSTAQGCCAKRTVQRNDNDDINGVAGGARYTVTYISEHTCKSIDSPAPVILETTAVRASQMQQQRAAPDDDDTCTVAAAFTAGSCSSSTSASTRPPSTTSTSSDIITATGTAWSTTSGDTTSWGDEHRDCGQLFAGDDDCRDRDTDATPVVISAAGFLDEMDFAGPIRSPVHITAGGWVDDNLLFDGLLDMSGAGRISRMFDL